MNAGRSPGWSRARGFFACALLALSGCGSDTDEPRPVPPGWGAPEALGTAEYVGTLVGDGRGQAAIVWLAPSSNDLGGPIVSRRFTPTSGWSAATTIDPAGARVFQSPVAGMDTEGRTIATWPETSGLFAARDAGGSWSAEARISRAATTSFRAQQAIGLDQAGRALAVWSEGGLQPPRTIAANRFDPGQGWSSPEVLWAAGGDDLTNPALAVASSGLALAAWAEGFGAERRLWWTTYDPRRGWAVSQPFTATTPREQLYGVDVALNASGQGLLSWVQDGNALVSRYTTAEGPGIPESFGAGAVQGLAVDEQGNGLALVTQPLGVPPALVLRRLRAGASTWDAPQSLTTEPASGALSMDANGDAWIVWVAGPGVFARPFRRAEGLGSAERIAVTSGASILQVMADVEGGALAAWIDVPGSPYTVRAARYTPR